MNKKMLIFAVLVLVSAAYLYLPVMMVQGQSPETRISSLVPSSGTAGQQFNVTVQGTIKTVNGPFVILFGNTQSTYVQINGTAIGNTVNENFVLPKLQPGNYSFSLKDVTNGTVFTLSFHIAAEGIAAIPVAAFLIMLVAVSISFVNMILNRVIITRMIGWHEYRSMQREIAEYNSQRMAALRAKDNKVLEKLKKKESQVQSMQTKMFKPQLVLIPITFIYLIIWPALTGVFPFAVAYVPGLGPQPFFIWYLICSFFFGTLASRVIGVTPIQ